MQEFKKLRYRDPKLWQLDVFLNSFRILNRTLWVVGHLKVLRTTRGSEVHWFIVMGVEAMESFRGDGSKSY